MAVCIAAKENAEMAAAISHRKNAANLWPNECAMNNESKTTSGLLLCFIFLGCLSAVYFTGRHIGYDAGVASIVILPLDPKLDFGAVCDGKNDDTLAFIQATKVARRIGWAVTIPDGCVAGYNFFVPSTSGTVP